MTLITLVSVLFVAQRRGYNKHKTKKWGNLHYRMLYSRLVLINTVVYLERCLQSVDLLDISRLLCFCKTSHGKRAAS